MKRILLLPSFLFLSLSVFSQFELTGSYAMAIPKGKMNDYINLTHSFGVKGIYRLPVNPKVWIGVDGTLGSYAQKTEKQTYQFTNGAITETNVRFSSNVVNIHPVIGYDLVKEGKVVPYVTVKAGLTNFYSSIYIEDPHDVDGCRPLQNKNVFGDVTFSYGGGAGLRFDGQQLFKSRSNNWALDLSVNYLMGGTLDYINVRHLQDNATPSPKEFKVQFVNVTTNEIHEHKVAEVYTSKLKQWEIRLGFVYRL